MRGAEDAKQCSLISLSEHCFRLSSLLVHNEMLFGERYRAKYVSSDEHLDWAHASDWLHVASSVVRTEVDTSRFDDSVGWCRTAWEYQSQRALLLSSLATQLAVFSFIWGALETVVKIIHPPKIPSIVKPSTSDIDGAIFFLKTHYEPSNPIPPYLELVAALRAILGSLHGYAGLSDAFRLEPFMGVSGVGLHVIRKVRNRLAHGTMVFPTPEDWGGSQSLNTELVETGCRIVLLSIQMLLDTYFRGDSFSLDATDVGVWLGGQASIRAALRTLHICRPTADDDQLTLAL